MPVAPSRTADRIGRALLVLAAVASVGAFADGLATIAAASPVLCRGWLSWTVWREAPARGVA